MAQKKLKVLFLDDETDFLEMAQNVMQSFAGDSWEIFTARNAGEALAIIPDKQIDLVVVDVHMPVVDGMQFLTLLNRKHPNLIKVCLSGGAAERERATCLSLGAELVLDKGETRASWQNVYSTLNELARHQPEEGFRGVLRRVSLPDVLQMECLSRSSAVLEISTKELCGHIFIKEGQIVHAEAAERTGEEAFNFLMSLAGGEFNLKPFREPPQRTIDSTWEFLLMESARKRDEAGQAIQPTDTEIMAAAAREAAVPAVDTRFFSKPPEVVPPQPAGEARPDIAELLVCSVQGDVLYEWQCADSNARITFLEFLSQKAWQVALGLPLGQFERLEIFSPKSRLVAELQNEHAVFVRTNLVAQS